MGGYFTPCPRLIPVTESFESTRPETLSRVLGKHFIYTYDTGWQYEMYIKDAHTIDYRIHSGMVGGRWVRDQDAHIVRLSDDVFKVSWDEPTGTSVSVSFNLTEREVHGVIFFPQWIEQNPELTVCYQNEHLDEMRQYRDEGRRIQSWWSMSSLRSRLSRTSEPNVRISSTVHPRSSPISTRIGATESHE